MLPDTEGPEQLSQSRPGHGGVCRAWHLLSKLRRCYLVNQCAGHSALGPVCLKANRGAKTQPHPCFLWDSCCPAKQAGVLGLALCLPHPPSCLRPTHLHSSDSTWIRSVGLPLILCPRTQDTCPSLPLTLPTACAADFIRGRPPLNQEFLKDRALVSWRPQHLGQPDVSNVSVHLEAPAKIPPLSQAQSCSGLGEDSAPGVAELL